VRILWRVPPSPLRTTSTVFVVGPTQPLVNRIQRNVVAYQQSNLICCDNFLNQTFFIFFILFIFFVNFHFFYRQHIHHIQCTDFCQICCRMDAVFVQLNIVLISGFFLTVFISVLDVGRKVWSSCS
jgi:hypothetical protein